MSIENPIKSAAIIGMGAMGVMYGAQIYRDLGRDAVAYVADPERIKRYQAATITDGGDVFDFKFIDSTDKNAEKVDLLIFAVKYTGMQAAIEACKHIVGPDTIIFSILNGIESEKDIAAYFGDKHLLHCMTKGMDAQKDGLKFWHQNIGWLVLGDADGTHAEDLARVLEFLDRAGLAYLLPDDIVKELWSKLMLNVGVNQVSAVRDVTFAGLQDPGEPRELMREAMRETMRVANCEGINLTEQDLEDWMPVLGRLDRNGYPSLAQDIQNRRPTEVELFSGTVKRLGEKHGIPTPVNSMLYDEIKRLEREGR